MNTVSSLSSAFFLLLFFLLLFFLCNQQGYVHIKTDHDSLVLPVSITVLSGGVHAQPSQLTPHALTTENGYTDVSINLLNTGASPVIIVGAFLSSGDPVRETTMRQNGYNGYPAEIYSSSTEEDSSSSSSSSSSTTKKKKKKKKGTKKGYSKKGYSNKKRRKKGGRGSEDDEDDPSSFSSSSSSSSSQMVVPPGLNSHVKQGRLLFTRGTPLPVGHMVPNALILRIHAR
jgi:hypothetical protein